MKREDKIRLLSKATAKEMMDEWEPSEIEERLGPICASSKVVVMEYAKLYWEDQYKKYDDLELDDSWRWLADYKGEIDGVKP